MERVRQQSAMAPMLCLDGICAGYGKKEILHGISLAVAPGEIVALLGPNGAGKSTILKIIAGLLRLHSGRVTFVGEDIMSVPPHIRTRMGIAYVMQGAPIFPALTVADHLEIGGRVARIQSRNDGMAAELLLPHLRQRQHDPAGVLSGGERQALAVAAALATQPRFLLCDEPSAGLAPSAADELLRRVAAASRERGLPVLWVEQRVASILPLADRAVLLRSGEIVAETLEPRKWLDGEVLSGVTFGGTA